MIQRVTLGSVAKVQAGYHARSQVMSESKGTHLLVQGKSIVRETGFKVEPSSLIRFIPERYIDSYLIKMGDVLVQAKGIKHFAFCFENPAENLIAADTFYLVRTDREILNPAFLAWWINQAPAQSYLHKNTGGTGIPFISRSVLEHVPVGIPALEIQIKIAEVEQLWQHRGELQKKLDEKTNQLIQAVCLASIKKEPSHE